MPNSKKSKIQKTTIEKDSSEDGEVSSTEDIDVEFEAFGICDKDTDGIVGLLKRAFVNEDVDVTEISNILTHQDGRGCIFMTALDDETDELSEKPRKTEEVEEIDNEIYGVVSFLDMGEHKDKTSVKQIKKLIRKQIEQNQSGENQLKFCNFLEKSCDNKGTALIINERLSNLPYHIALPAFQALQHELDASNKRFNHFLMFLKVQKLNFELPQTSGSKNASLIKGKKRKNTSSSNVTAQPTNEIFMNSEEELLLEECPCQLVYECGGAENSDGVKRCKHIILFDRPTLDRFVQKLEKDIQQHCSG